jgi:putative membrane protein insertion efficiency factor
VKKAGFRGGFCVPKGANTSFFACFFLLLIRLYQFTLSSFMGTQCRFHPTCSNYTAEAVRRFGAGEGIMLGLLRICRCHPWNPGGHDPVPGFPPEKPVPSFPSKEMQGCDKSVSQ